jgi:hypothetical protein
MSGGRVVSVGLSRDEEGWFLSVGVQSELTAQRAKTLMLDGVRVIVTERGMATALAG